MNFYDCSGYDPSTWEEPLTSCQVFDRVSRHIPQSRLPVILYKKGAITGEEFLDSLLGDTTGIHYK